MKNKNLLEKCIKELRAETPKIDYILGILETLSEIEQEPEKPVVPPVVFNPPVPLPTFNASVNPHGLPPNDPGMDILSGNKIING